MEELLELRGAEEELSQLDTDLLELSIGPQHPSTHGVFRVIARLDGENVVALEPVMGYLHRCHEKIAEGLTYPAIMPFTDRLDYICGPTNNLAYALAVEKLGGVEVPERAQVIRVIMAELTRLVNHLLLIGFLTNDLGCYFTPVLYAFREREKILDIFEAVTGGRMCTNYCRIGGVAADLTPEMVQEIRKLVEAFPAFVDEFEMLLNENEILQNRCKNVGILTAEQAVNAGLTGPLLRASGVNYDIRKVDGYCGYDQYEFRVPLGTVGDTYDRYMLRVLEMRESVKILRQALDRLPEGPVRAKAPRVFKPPKGDAYGRIESPKGELGFYLVSDGTPKPYRYKVRPPSFVNLTLLEEMCVGNKIADLVVILGSIDIVLGEVDR
jgi:NADH-quinone oxidoreductase subunit D